MSEIKTSIIKFNYKEGKFSISGNEDFINQNLNILLEFVKDNNLVKYQSDNKQINDSNINLNVHFDDYIQKYIEAGIVHIDEEGNISILKNIPYENKSDKVKNIALIYLFIKNKKIYGNDSNLIKLCKLNTCYESKNFARIFTREKNLFIRDNSSKIWTIELTKPGKEAAIKLLDEMVNGNK